jgi:hypothetical protein
MKMEPPQGYFHTSAWKVNSRKSTFTILHRPSLIDLSQPPHGTVKSSMPHYILWFWIKIQVAESYKRVDL